MADLRLPLVRNSSHRRGISPNFEIADPVAGCPDRAYVATPFASRRLATPPLRFPILPPAPPVRPALAARLIVLLLGLCFAPAAAAQQPDREEAEDALADDEESWLSWFRGRLTLRYLHRDSDLDDRDQDLYQYLSLSGGDSRRDAVTAHLYARGAWDIDGSGLGPTGSSLSSLQDTQGGDYDLNLYDAYLDFHRILPDGRIRVGRQNLFETPVLLHLDGASARAPLSLGEERFEWELYGGVPEHRWESARSGDLAVGTALHYSPWENGMLRLDALYLEDENLFGDPSNMMWSARLSQVSAEGRSFGSVAASILDGDFRDAAAQLSWTSEDQRWQLFGSTRFLLTRQSANTLEFDPFTAILMDEEPFAEGQIVASHYLLQDLESEQLRVDLGAYARELRDSDRASEFNREFNRYWAGVGLEQIPWQPVELSFTGEVWDSGDDQFTTFGADLTAQLSSRARVSVGSFYSLYKFDFFSGLERDRVRDFYARWRQELSDRVRLTLDLQYEEDDLEDFQIAWIQVELFF